MYKRIYLAFFGLIAVFGLLISNIGIIILNTGSSPSSQSKSSKSLIVSTSRGMIYDTNMKKIVNSNTETVTVCLPTQDALNAVKSYVNEDELKDIQSNIKNGKISILTLPKRFYDNQVRSVAVINRYSDSQPCVHLIGHLDENNKGAMGLEKAYESYLSKHTGALKAVWSSDAIGNILLGEGIDFESDNYLSPAGIQLTIDLDIQQIAENALVRNNIEKGSAVVLNSDTNEILAVVSLPTFNPNDISSDMTNEDSPFINRAITPYSVGSVFKPFVAACGIENNIQFTYNCTGSITVNGTTFKCSNDTSHGNVDMKTATEKSCNTYFIALGQETGAEKIINLCNDFGLGKSLELADNFYLKTGNLPSVDEITSPQALANLSFGQGELLASPVHMAVAYSCFANGGYYRPPTLMKAIIDENGKAIQKVTPSKSYRILNKSTVDKIDKILKSVVDNGNGSQAYSENVENHGKTATAQSGWYENGREITHTWFCGYFKADGTTYTVVIFKDDGKSGAVDCAPVFKDISEQISDIKQSSNE